MSDSLTSSWLTSARKMKKRRQIPDGRTFNRIGGRLNWTENPPENPPETPQQHRRRCELKTCIESLGIKRENERTRQEKRERERERERERRNQKKLFNTIKYIEEIIKERNRINCYRIITYKLKSRRGIIQSSTILQVRVVKDVYWIVD